MYPRGFCWAYQFPAAFCHTLASFCAKHFFNNLKHKGHPVMNILFSKNNWVSNAAARVGAEVGDTSMENVRSICLQRLHFE